MGILSTGKNTKHICLSLCAGTFKFEIQKRLGIFLESKLDFKEYIQNVLNKISIATKTSKNFHQASFNKQTTNLL